MRGQARAMQRAGRPRCAFCPVLYQFRRATHGKDMTRDYAIKGSTDRILTTHVGSLIRPAPLQEFLRAKRAGKSYDRAAYEACLRSSVAEVVRKQADVGVDVVSDGEFGKSISWSQYVL